MKNIFFRDGILIYYGNPAGYLSEGKVVLDSIFDKEEIIAFLSEKEKLAVEIRSGVYDRLSEGGGMEMTVEASKGRRIRIYQLKQDSLQYQRGTVFHCTLEVVICGDDIQHTVFDEVCFALLTWSGFPVVLAQQLHDILHRSVNAARAEVSQNDQHHHQKNREEIED